ncbi:MAG: hypothetical protein RIN56_09670 [Sporomusaceae bacterium]|nr:hypothetical protein [Sporomusaceae bacterium]
MKKIVILMAAVLLLAAAPVCASPLQDFSSGRLALDLNWKPYSFSGGHAAEFGVTAGLGGHWALAFRQINFDTAGHTRDYGTHNREINLIRKLGDGLQLYVGHSRTCGGAGINAKNVLQAGVIAARKLGDRYTLYAILGGGKNVANIEFGLSYRLNPHLELTSTYRHLTADKIGEGAPRHNYRGFGLGLTWKI